MPEEVAEGGLIAFLIWLLLVADCNNEKGTRDIREFLAHDPERLEKILAQAQRPLRDAAVMNSIRYAIGNVLKSLGLPISFWTGGRTKMNRIKQGYPQRPLDRCGLCRHDRSKCQNT